MGRTKLSLLLVVLVAAGCASAPKETAKSAAPPKLPPGMSFGYKPPK